MDDPTELLEGPRLTKKFPDVLSLDEINSMLALIDHSTSAGVRNRAMLETLYAVSYTHLDVYKRQGLGMA